MKEIRSPCVPVVALRRMIHSRSPGWGERHSRGILPAIHNLCQVRVLTYYYLLLGFPGILPLKIPFTVDAVWAVEVVKY